MAVFPADRDERIMTIVPGLCGGDGKSKSRHEACARAGKNGINSPDSHKEMQMHLLFLGPNGKTVPEPEGMEQISPEQRPGN
jgi:hypothetical protein